jgi:tRNA 2-thiouridine synthesizing protein A
MKFAIDKFLDTSGLLCPEPVMMLHKAVTDPSTVRDIPKFCHFLGHELLAQEERGNDYIYYIKKSKA